MKVLITGGHGMLARAIAAELSRRAHHVHAPGRAELDVLNEEDLRSAMRLLAPDVVIHCAAWTRVDDAERNAAAAFALNAGAAETLARAANDFGARLVYPSSDYVFDGTAHVPYEPDAPTHPLSVYGRSKLAGEACARLAHDHVIVRTSWLYGAGGGNFVRTISERLRTNASLRVVNDQTGSLTWTRDVAAMLVGLLEREAPAGIYHATSSGSGTWYDAAREIARLLGVDPDAIEPCSTADYPVAAKRPAYSVLNNAKTEAIVGACPDWRDALARSLAAGDY